MPDSTFANPQTSLRLAIQENGYAWVPNNGKRTRGKGWPTKALQRLNSASVQSALWWDYPRADDGDPIDLPNPSTGILIEGDLVALDVDIDNADAVGAIFNLACELFGEDWQERTLIRQRAGSRKECWLFRVDVPAKGDTLFQHDGKVVGPKYWPPGTPEHVAAGERLEAVGDGFVRDHGSPQTIEIFRGGRAQIGALGWHTVPNEETGTEGIKYEWLDDMSPATVHRENLPKVSHTQLYAFYERYGEVLANMAWVKDTAPTGAGGGTYVYDLPTDRTFFTGTKGVPEEISAEALDTGDNVRMFEIIGEGTNPERGHCFRKPNGVLGVYDREKGVWHYPASEDPERSKVRAERLARMLQRISQGDTLDSDQDDALDEGGHPDDEVLERVDTILKGHGVTPSIEGEDIAEVLDIYDDVTKNWDRLEDYQVEARAQLLAMRWLFVRNLAAKSDQRWKSMIPGHASIPTGEFEALYAGATAGIVTRVNADGAPMVTVKPVAKIFANSGLQVRVQGEQFGPWTDERVVKARDNERLMMVNTYTPPRLGEVQEELVQLLDGFLEHLFDNTDERAIFEEVMAYKFANPGARGVTHIFVADGVEGTGRNTLFEAFIFNALGADNCMKLASDKLETSRGQSAFTSWQYNRLMWFVPEIAGLSRRSLDALKELMEVSSGKTSGTEKGGRDLYDRVYGSMFMATNNPGAVPLDMKSENRRFNVYSSGAKGPLNDNPELSKRVNAVRVGSGTDVTEDMAASVAHYFLKVVPERMGRAPRQELFMQAQDTPAKRRMMALSRKQSDEYIEEVLEELEGQGRTYVELGSVQERAIHAARAARASKDVITAIPDELQKQTSGGRGFNGWVRVFSDQGADRLKIAGGNKKRILAHGQDAADAFRDMSLNERAEAMTYVPAGDEKVTRLAAAAAEVVSKRRREPI